MPTTEKLRRCAAAFWNDTSGAILPYVTIMLVVIVGTSVLALDGARYMSLQTQLQKGADALAVAGGAELDRLPDAITRATNAVNNLVANGSLFGPSGNQTVVASTVRFLRSLPAADSTWPIPNSDVTTDPTMARFIEVTVLPVPMQTILPASFFGGANSATAAASAVAGFDMVNCGLTPMFVCNPFEQPGDTYAQAVQRLVTADTDPAFRSKLIRFADHGNNPGTWGPGDFGYLVPETGSLTSDSCFPSAGHGIGEAMAASRSRICVRQNGVDLQPGNASAALDGLNTRFGLYGNNMPESCKATYPPDVNVRKGYEPKKQGQTIDWCRATPNGSWPPGNVAKSLPLDSCFASSCSPGNVGNGVWDCQAYWNSAHPSALGHSPPAGCTNAATISRYSVYQYEISNNYLGDASPPAGANLPGETGTPQCSPGTALANRRILTVALVNCGSSPVPIQSNAQNVPVAAFGRFFLTVPVPTAANNKPYGEFLGLLKRGQGTLFDQVQLYR